jgi:hypothetical protein
MKTLQTMYMSSLTGRHMRHIVLYKRVHGRPMPKRETKLDRLGHLGALNPRPQAVRAAWFHPTGFFDANDFVQVKYEMLRHARLDGASKAEAAALFGVSRPT